MIQNILIYILKNYNFSEIFIIYLKINEVPNNYEL